MRASVTKASSAAFAACVAVLIVPVLSLPALADEACRKSVEEAFTKQRQSKAFRSTVTNPAASDGAEQVFEYLPPLVMRRLVTAPSMPQPLETIAFGNRAWIMEISGWLEMQPHFAETHKQHLADMFAAPPSIKADYSCLGDTEFEGRPYAAYRTEPEKGDDGELLVRTIYVDTSTGLPAYNIVGTLSGGKPALVREAYTYPSDLKIEIPEGAPMQSMQH